MAHATRTRRAAVMMAMLLLMARPGAGDDAPALPNPHIRSTDAELLDAVSAGARQSQTLHALVDRIDRSDVIVYLERGSIRERGLAGRLRFIAAAGGRRYVHIEIDSGLAGAARVAALAHELQHAAEVAGAPAVVDEATLVALYRRIGFESHSGFESGTAVEAGRRAWRETMCRSRGVPIVNDAHTDTTQEDAWPPMSSRCFSPRGTAKPPRR